MLRKIVLTLACLVTVLFASHDEFAKKMNYFVNYTDAVKYSVNKNKPIMMTIVTTTCPWCKKLENQTLKKENIDTLIKTNFTPLLLNRDKDTYPKEKFNAKVVPTTFFIDPIKQEIIHKVYGYKSKKEFLKQLEIAQKLSHKGHN